MANDSFDISVKGLGGATKGASIDTSGIQKSIDTIAADLKRLDTSNFQRSLKDLALNIQKSATAASTFIANMQKLEAQISTSLQKGFSKQAETTTQTTTTTTAAASKSPTGMSPETSEKFTKSINSLGDSIEKLAIGIKEGFKPSGNEPPAPEGPKPADNIIGDVKKILAAVGIGALIRQVSENEIITPARAQGMLINSNVVSNTRQAGSELLSSYQGRVANNTSLMSGGIGAGIGGILGSVLPGVGTLVGAGLGGALGSTIGGTIGQSKLATELPTLQRSLNYDFYQNISKQNPQYNEFGKAQYGDKGFGAPEAFQDPYLESKAALGKGYSRFAGGSLPADTTGNILKSLTAQGASSPQELAITGNLLGQIARFTGKSATDIEKVYKSVERSGMAPNEGLQKALSLLQSGLPVAETEKIIQKTSQRSEAFSEGQNSYLGATPFQQFTAQQAGKVTHVDTEKFFQGNEEERSKAREIFQKAEIARREGRIDQFSIFSQTLQTQQGITPAMAEERFNVPKSNKDEGFLKLSETQDKIIDTTQKSITQGAKGRGPTEIVQETLSEIGKSTESFSALKAAANSLTDSFKSAAESFGSYVAEHSPLNITKFFEPAKKPLAQTPGGR